MYEGKQISSMPAHKLVPMGIAMSPEGRGVFANLSVRENLEMGAFIRKDRKGISDDMERGFTLFPRLKEREQQKAGTLSGGEQQMLAMARALMSRPRLLLLDEPSLGLAPLVVHAIFQAIDEIKAEGATILTHRNNEQVLERLLSGSRTLVGDSLSKVTSRRTNVVEGVGDRDVRKGTNGKIVELHRIPNEHSDGMLAVLLPAEKVLWTADITVVNPNPVQLATLRAAVVAFNRLKLDYNTWIPAHPPNPDRPITKADVLAAAGTN